MGGNILRISAQTLILQETGGQDDFDCGGGIPSCMEEVGESLSACEEEWVVGMKMVNVEDGKQEDMEEVQQVEEEYSLCCQQASSEQDYSDSEK